MSAPNLKEIEWAISELEGKESSESRYILLSALYTCRNEMLGLCAAQPQIAVYSESSVPAEEPLGEYGDSDFLHIVSGKDPSKAWRIMDDLMETLRVVNPRVYDSVIMKIEKL